MADNDMMTGFLAGQDSGGKGDGMFGGDGSWIVLIILFALFGGGFGGNGFGGNRSGGGDCATQADLCNSFNFNNLENSVRGVQNGICDSTYALNTSLLNGFHGVDNAVCNLGYQMQSCCCETNRNVDNLRYDMSKGFCDVIQNAHNDADRIIGYLTQDKIQSLQTELQSAQLQLSNAAQTQAIVDQIRPCPIPAYPACNPWATNSFSGCGCGV